MQIRKHRVCWGVAVWGGGERHPDPATRCWAAKTEASTLFPGIPVPLCSLSSPTDSQVWTQIDTCAQTCTYSFKHTHTHTYTPGDSDIHFRSQASGQGRPKEASLMAQEAEALGAADFLSICLFPKCTHCPPAHTNHATGEPPSKVPQPNSNRAATWGFSSCSHFCPLLTDEETGAQSQDQACQRREEDRRRWEANPGSVHRLLSPKPPQSPDPSSPYSTSSRLHTHFLPRKSLEVYRPWEVASPPFLPGPCGYPGPMSSRSHWGTGSVGVSQLVPHSTAWHSPGRLC